MINLSFIVVYIEIFMYINIKGVNKRGKNECLTNTAKQSTVHVHTVRKVNQIKINPFTLYDHLI